MEFGFRGHWYGVPVGVDVQEGVRVGVGLAVRVNEAVGVGESGEMGMVLREETAALGSRRGIELG